MNILLVSHELSVTGAPKVLLWMSKYLSDCGHKVDLWTIDGGNLQDEYEKINIIPKFIKNNKRLIYNEFKKHVKRYDLVICNTIITQKFVDVFVDFKVPVVWYIHESGYLEDVISTNDELAHTIKNFYNIYTVSEYAKNIINKYNSNVRIIPNSVDDTFSGFGNPRAKVSFGYIGQISMLKGVDILVNSFIKLSKKYKDIELYLAGNNNTELGEKYRKITKTIPNVKWLGEVRNQDKENFWDHINVLCAPSVYDSCSLSVLEGAMKGKVIITTDTNGANYVIKNSSNGFIIPSQNEVELYMRMEELVKKSTDIAFMQKKSREMYLQYASVKIQEQAVDKMLEDNRENYPAVDTVKKHLLGGFLYKMQTKKHNIYCLGPLAIKIRKRK